MRFLPFALAALVLFAATDGSAKPRQRPSPRRATGAAYRAHVQKWHAKASDARAPTGASGRPMLVIENVNTGARAELEAETDQGGFDESAQARAASVLGDSRRDAERVMDPALLDLLYRLQRRFDAPCIRVVSAYRAGGSSQHARGRAADVVVPGVEDREVATWARSLGHTGVGLYPRSGFVHVDVRESPHYWVDASGPGESGVRKRKPGKKSPRSARP